MIFELKLTKVACRLYGVLGRTYMFDIDFAHLSEFSMETGSVPALSAPGSRSSIEVDGDTGPKTPATTSEPTDREILYAVDAFHVGNVSFFFLWRRAHMLIALDSIRASWSVLYISVYSLSAPLKDISFHKIIIES
jgi:hypothetical protein